MINISLLIISFILITNIYIVFHDIKNRKISNNVVLIIMFVGFFLSLLKVILVIYYHL